MSETDEREGKIESDIKNSHQHGGFQPSQTLSKIVSEYHHDNFGVERGQKAYSQKSPPRWYASLLS